MIARACVVIFLAGAAAMPVAAQSDLAVQVIKIGAWAHVLAERCPTLEVNWSRYGSMMRQAGLSPDDVSPTGKHGKLYGAFLSEALAETRSSSQTASCASGRSLYGPAGKNMPGLLVPKG